MSEWLDKNEQGLYETICDPVAAIRGVFGFNLWGKQADIARSIVKHERTTVKACHSSGKTAIAARLAAWWLIRYPQASKVLTTAPTDNQVRRALWGEFHSAIKRARELRTVDFPVPNQTELRLGEHWWAYGFSTSVTGDDQGVRFQGFHGEHVLIIFDESIGIHPQIWNSLEGILSSGHVRFLSLCNPTVPSGPAYDTFTDPDYNKITISAFDTPNLEGLTLEELTSWSKDDPRLDENPFPALLSRRWVYTRFHKWGLEHPHFQARVLGQFPTQSKYSLFPLALLERAKYQESTEDKNEQRAVGIDVAGSGDNETVVTLRSGGRILGIWSWTTPDPRGEVLRLLEALAPLDLINVDSIGIGYNFALHLADTFGLMGRDDGGKVQLVNVSLPSLYPLRFVSRKAEFYWSLSELFKELIISFAESARTGVYDGTIQSSLNMSACVTGKESVDTLVAQLAGLQYEPTSRGAIRMEGKESMAKRGLVSPDHAESAMLAYVPPLELTEGTQIVEYEEEFRISKY